MCECYGDRNQTTHNESETCEPRRRSSLAQQGSVLIRRKGSEVEHIRWDPKDSELFLGRLVTASEAGRAQS
jgi:hypothetical protein